MANERILIVEDKVALEGRPLEAILQKAGYQVVGIAKTEEQAVTMALRERPSVALVDIQLKNAEGKNDRLAGFRAAQRIRSEIGAEIIFITGILTEPDVWAAAQKTPDSQFLVKPVTSQPKQLLALIQLALVRAKRTAEMTSKRKVSIFVCYSHQDKRYADEMMKILRVMDSLGIFAWIDSEIDPGQKWKSEMVDALADATAAVCLVSPSFVDSKFITEVELPAHLKAEAERGLRVYPVYVHYVHEVILKPMGLLDFQGINRPAEPIAKWSPARRNQDCWGILARWLGTGRG